MQITQMLRQIVTNPVEAYYKAVARGASRRRDHVYQVDRDWQSKLGVTDVDRRDDLWSDTTARLEHHGIRPGPDNYLGWNDGDPAFVRAICCLIRRLKALKVVETGVAHGVTTRFILETLTNDGRLWSIDLPPVKSMMAQKIGIAIPDMGTPKWTFLRGSSQRHLPGLLKSIAPIDLFIHDSDHRSFNMKFEMRLAWKALRPGGALVVDDIDVNDAFHAFTTGLDAMVLVAEAQPLHPDYRRFNHKGLFGIVLKGHSDDSA